MKTQYKPLKDIKIQVQKLCRNYKIGLKQKINQINDTVFQRKGGKP
jgi:hypothetical protein